MFGGQGKDGFCQIQKSQDPLKIWDRKIVYWSQNVVEQFEANTQGQNVGVTVCGTWFGRRNTLPRQEAQLKLHFACDTDSWTTGGLIHCIPDKQKTSVIGAVNLRRSLAYLIQQFWSGSQVFSILATTCFNAKFSVPCCCFSACISVSYCL